MTRKRAIEILLMSDQAIWLKGLEKEQAKAIEMAINSLEAWEIINDNLSQQVHHNLDVKEKFEVGSPSRNECVTAASTLSGVLYLIHNHLKEVENE